MSRPSYKIVDNIERKAYIASRNNILAKSFVTDLWMRVINRAIDDLVIYTLCELNGKELSDEEKEYKESAYGFLFDDDYTIALDDYDVVVRCQKCSTDTAKKMSVVTGEHFICPHCKNKVTAKTASSNIVYTYSPVEVTLKELLSYWGIENIDVFRSGCKKRINHLVSRRRKKYER